MTTSFLYFAYGSNMLTKRLRERCPSARPAGIAVAEEYRLDFSKVGLDGSGKATLSRNTKAIQITHIQGVLYHVSLKESTNLDLAEGRYDRHANFLVKCQHKKSSIIASTYIAQPDACSNGLLPFDWYVRLIIAGAYEHGLDPAYIARLRNVKTRTDPDTDRAESMARLLR